MKMLILNMITYELAPIASNPAIITALSPAVEEEELIIGANVSVWVPYTKSERPRERRVCRPWLLLGRRA